MTVRIQLNSGADALIQQMADDYVEASVLPKIEAAAKRIAPVDTGELRDSIHTEVSGDGMFVVADAPHAVHVEQGTSKMAAQPFLRPAMNTNLG